MLAIASREIHEAREAHERRRRADQRRSAIMAALDRLLGELEELRLTGATEAPAACRARTAALIAQVFGLAAPQEVPPSVSRLMDEVYAAQDAVLAGHRRAYWGIRRRSRAHLVSA